MAKYITAFLTINDYNVSKEGLDYPNISLIKSDNHIEWAMEAPTPQYQGFCKLTLNDDSVVELEGSGELTDAMTSSYQSTLVSAEIGALCTSIGMNAFLGCHSLTSVTIGNSVTSIGNSAFADCPSLTNVTIGNSVTSIDDFAFKDCTSLTNLIIPSSVISIGSVAFDNCTWWSTYSADTSNHYGNIIYINNVAYRATAETITSCEFKEGTVSIGDGAFENCSNLTNVDIPNSVTYIGMDAFRDCDGLTSVTIGNSVTSIGDGAFRYCSNLTNVDIPNSVTSISNEAFYNCTSLTSIDIPNSVTSIGEAAFYNCSSLTSVTVEPTTPPTLGTNAFDNTNNCPIYVPSESENTYKAASGWSDYESRITVDNS